MPYISYAIIMAICAVVCLVVFEKMKDKYYPYLLYAMAAGMALMIPLAGDYLVGSDVHLEWYYNQLHTGADVVPPVMGIPQGTSIITYLPASIWMFKVVYPLLFAFTPVILYLVFRRWLDGRRAFLASSVFIIFPAFYIELPFIARQMVAEVMLCLLLYLLMVSNLRMRYKVIAIVGCSAVIPLIHYALWPVLVIMATPWLVAAFVLKRRETAKLVGVSLAVVVVVGAMYFSFAEDGVVVRKLLRAYTIITPVAIHEDMEPVVVYPKIYEPELEEPDEPPSYLMKFEPLIRTAVGVDFSEINTLGKIFRALQLVMPVLILVGLWRLRKDNTYILFASGPIFFLVLCLAIPELSGYLNITRIVHITLILLAPAVVVAVNPKYLLVWLIPYFLFSSGMVFEMTKQPNIESINIPYNIAISNHRIDLGASATEDDLAVSKYIIKNSLFPLYSDVYASYILVEEMGLRDDINRPLPKGDVPDFSGSYIFFRSRNIQDGSFVVWNGIGCRYHWSWDHYGFTPDENIIYQEGDARVVWIP